MRKVKMLISQYGPVVSRNPGDIVEVSNKEAKAMIEGNIAEPVSGRARETTAKKITRSTTSRTPQKKGVMATVKKVLGG